MKASEEALVREEAELKARRIDEMVRSKKNWVALQDLKKKNSTGQVTLMYSNFCNYAPGWIIISHGHHLPQKKKLCTY